MALFNYAEEKKGGNTLFPEGQGVKFNILTLSGRRKYWFNSYHNSYDFLHFLDKP